MVRSYVRTKETIYKVFPTSLIGMQRKFLEEEARQLHIENVETLSIKGLSREIAIAQYRTRGE